MYPRLRTSRHASRQAGDGRTKQSLFALAGTSKHRQRTWGVCVAESAMAPPSPIPNLVVPHGSAGEYCTGNRVGGEAAAHTPQLRCLIQFRQGTVPSPPRGGAVAARWAHNPKVVGSNPAPATSNKATDPSQFERGPLLCWFLPPLGIVSNRVMSENLIAEAWRRQIQCGHRVGLMWMVLGQACLRI